MGSAVGAATVLCLMCAWLLLALCTRCNMLILCTNTIVRNLCTKFMHKVAQKDVTLLVCLVQSALTQTKLTAIRHNYICRQSFHFRHQPTILRGRKARSSRMSSLPVQSCGGKANNCDCSKLRRGMSRWSLCQEPLPGRAFKPMIITIM